MTITNLISHAFLAMTLTLMSPFANARPSADGASNGGGGGYIVVNGELKLPTEAGVKVYAQTSHTLPNYYSISKQTEGEVKRIVSALDISDKSKDAFVNAILPNVRTFVGISSIEPKLEKEIRDTYIQVVKQNGQKFPVQLMQFAAVSDKNVTYILPGFARLSYLQQAKLLIHEASYRIAAWNPWFSKLKVEMLAKILAIDTQIEEVVTSTEQGTLIDHLPLVQLLVSHYYFIKSLKQDEFYLSMRRLEARKGSTLLFSDLFSSEDPITKMTQFNPELHWQYISFSRVSMDPIKLQSASQDDPSVRNLLDRAILRPIWNYLFYAPELKDVPYGKSFAIAVNSKAREFAANYCAALPHLNNQKVTFIHAHSAYKQVFIGNCAFKTVLIFDMFVEI